MKLLLLRHGEASKVGTDEILTDLGHKQAELLAKRLAKITITKCYVSEATRAFQTFEHYQKLVPTSSFIKTPKIKEIYRVIVGGPKREGTPESREGEDKKRIDLFLEELKENTNDSVIAVFAHGNVIRYIIGFCLGMPLKNLWEALKINCGSFSLLDLDVNKKSILVVNSIDHLGKDEFQSLTTSQKNQKYLD